MSSEDLLRELERLRKENEALKRQSAVEPVIRISPKGAVSIYGLQRFPITLYKNQWQRLFAMQDAIKAFIIENNADLK